MTTDITYNGLLALQTAIKNELDLVNVPINHYFVEGSADGTTSGVYAREAVIAKGTVGVGKIHKYAQLNIMTKGDMSVATPTGVQRITAPFVIVTPPGMQRAIFAHEDSTWITIHGTNVKDVSVIEKTFVVDSHEQFLEYIAEQQLLEVK